MRFNLVINLHRVSINRFTNTYSFAEGSSSVRWSCRWFPGWTSAVGAGTLVVYWAGLLIAPTLF